MRLDLLALLLLLATFSACQKASTENPASTTSTIVGSATADIQSESSASDTPEPGGGDLIDSKVLTREMVSLTVKMLKRAYPEKTSDELLPEAGLLIGKEIAKARKRFPQYLMVSASVEQELAQGKKPADTDARIKAAEKNRAELELPLPPVAQTLLSSHKAGRLNGPQSELLAQVLEGTLGSYKAALEN